MYRNGNPARLKMQFFDLLLVRWIFGRQIGHKNYEDFEHPTFSPTFARFYKRHIVQKPMPKLIIMR